MTLKAEKFEELLTGELTRSLEPQRGKALAAFRAHVAQEAERPAIAGSLKRDGGREISRPELWFWTSVPSLAAACLAVVLTLKVIGPGAGGVVAPARQAGATQVQQTVVVSSEDGGVLVSDSGPMRVTREQSTKTTQWVDPRDNSVYKLTEPGERVNYEQLRPF